MGKEVLKERCGERGLGNVRGENERMFFVWERFDMMEKDEMREVMEVEEERILVMRG